MQLRLIKDDTNINFVGLRFWAFGLLTLTLLWSVFALVTDGLNLAIDFTGGTVIEIQTDGPADIADLRDKFSKLDLGSVTIQQFGTDDTVAIRVPQQANATKEGQAQLLNRIKAALGDTVLDYRRVEYVGPQVGAELIKKSFMALSFALIGIMIYVWVRFEWPYGVASIVGLVHDAFVTVGFFAITQIEFNLATVAAVLTIIGYSINDTVVVFDRIRENLRKYKRQPLGQLINNAINQTLSRTVTTSLATLLALVALWLFGGEVLRSFITAMIFGIVLGTFSSIFVAAPLLLYIRPDVLRPGMTSKEALAGS